MELVTLLSNFPYTLLYLIRNIFFMNLNIICGQIQHYDLIEHNNYIIIW